MFLMSITPEPRDFQTPFDQPPKWAREAIWYQIFTERFRNGNSNNDPTLKTCDNALIDPFPTDWRITPWGFNWYKRESWASKLKLDFYRTIQMRRYGGDLDGVIEKIDYLKELGITAVYFNPLNDSPSLHKYDVRHYHHIDVTFGDDPEGDMKMIALENHLDPTTWQITSADKKFLKLIEMFHENDIRVIVDFSFNHTGNNFWAFKDVLENPETSPFKDWYYIDVVTDPKTGKIDVKYRGWMGIINLPELKKVDEVNRRPGFPYEGNLHPKVKKHIFDITKRWMDPYGNGDISKGIDGMRLDVAEHVPLGFWRDFRRYTRSMNPDFYLVGECWWEEWPDKLMNPKPWLKGDVFDAVMHYQWYKLARGFFAEPNDKVELPEFSQRLTNMFSSFPKYTQQAMMNLASSHDSPRVLSAFFNVNKYKFHCKPQEDKNYRTDLPGDMTYHRVRLFLLHQFTFVGAPHIWNGDEMGMTGADDPDNRKPLVWPDITFDMETQSEYSDYQYEYQPAFDNDMFEYYKSLIRLRKSNLVLTYGDFEMKDISSNQTILAYTRKNEESEYWILFNFHIEFNEAHLPFSDGEIVFKTHADHLHLEPQFLIPPYSGVVIRRKIIFED